MTAVIECKAAPIKIWELDDWDKASWVIVNQAASAAQMSTHEKNANEGAKECNYHHMLLRRVK